MINHLPDNLQDCSLHSPEDPDSCCGLDRSRVWLWCGVCGIRWHCGIVAQQMAVCFQDSGSHLEKITDKISVFGIGMTEFCVSVPYATAGVLIAQALNNHTEQKWRWCYYIGNIYGVICLVGTFVFYHPPERPQHDLEKSRWQEVRKIDYMGCVLYTGGLTTFLIGISWAAARLILGSRHLRLFRLS